MIASGVATADAAPLNLDTRLSLAKLEVLCLVVELGSVARAAEHLSVGVPVVLSHIRSVEQRCGVTLLVRGGRAVELTEPGERVYEWAVQTLARGRAMVRDLQSLDTGLGGAAAIGASMSLGSYLLPPVLAAFLRERPNMQLTMSVGDPETMVKAVQQGELDFCVVISEPTSEAAGLSAELLGREEIVLVTAADGEPYEDEIELDRILELPLISAPPGTARRQVLDAVLGADNSVLIQPRLCLGHPEGARRAVMAGLGVTLVSRSAVERDLASGLLREVRLVDAKLELPICAVRRRDKRLSAVQEQLLDAIRLEVGLRRAGGSHEGTSAGWS
jgi:DNA-binding transcriptional LysR family regulator